MLLVGGPSNWTPVALCTRDAHQACAWTPSYPKGHFPVPTLYRGGAEGHREALHYNSLVATAAPSPQLLFCTPRQASLCPLGGTSTSQTAPLSRPLRSSIMGLPQSSPLVLPASTSPLHSCSLRSGICFLQWLSLVYPGVPFILSVHLHQCKPFPIVNSLC